MAKVKKPLEENGIHRAKTWEIGLYALNNTSTNMWMMVVSYITYYLIGIVGVGSVLAGSLVTIMRVWDGCTDPFVGMLVDKTNTKFGKNRPFIVIGWVIMFISTWLIFNVLPMLPGTSAVRLPVYIIIYMIYIIGYTCGCVVTKSAQTCLTNDPEQRPVFAMFDTVYNLVTMSLIVPLYTAEYLVPKHTLVVGVDDAKLDALVAQNPNLANVMSTKEGVTTLSGFYNPALFQEMQLTLGMVSLVFAICAIIGLSRKDNPKYFGTGGAPQKVGIKDYADTLCHNRAIQMLVVSAASDKLSMSMMSNATIMICLYGIIFGNYSLYASYSQIAAVPQVLLTLWAFNKFARKMGQKAAMMFGTYAGLIGAVILGALLIIGNPEGQTGILVYPTFSLVKPSTWGNLFNGANWTLLGAAFIICQVLWRAFSACSNSIVITMTADCADYEVYRTGKYVPGLMGTLFSFVDKLISSLASTIVAALFSAIGFAVALPDQNTPYSSGIFWVTLFCFLGAPIIGWLCNIVAMKFYPLTKEKMESIQDEIARIKAEAAAQ